MMFLWNGPMNLQKKDKLLRLKRKYILNILAKILMDKMNLFVFMNNTMAKNTAITRL